MFSFFLKTCEPITCKAVTNIHNYSVGTREAIPQTQPKMRRDTGYENMSVRLINASVVSNLTTQRFTRASAHTHTNWFAPAHQVDCFMRYKWFWIFRGQKNSETGVKAERERKYMAPRVLFITLWNHFQIGRMKNVVGLLIENNFRLYFPTRPPSFKNSIPALKIDSSKVTEAELFCGSENCYTFFFYADIDVA